MPVSNSLEVVGVKDALRELNDIDKKLRRQITRDYQEIVKPVVDEAKGLVPRRAPLSGMERSWTPKGASEPVLPFGANSSSRSPRGAGVNWQQSRSGRRRMGEWLKWQAGVRAYISGKKPRTFNGYTKNLATFGVRWLGSASVLFDTSGRASTPQGQRMIAALNSRFGQPSRVMWRAYQKEGPEIQGEMRDLVNKIMESVDRKTRV
jgi:hypothetical protein